MTEERTRRIQERAHSIWEREGHPHGRDAQHWSQAEHEIDAEDAAGASSPIAMSTGRRQPKPRGATKTVADISGASLEQATGAAADISAEEPVKTRGRKPKAAAEDTVEAPKARRGRSSKGAAEVSADAPVKTRGRNPKAATEEGAEAPKAARGRKAKAVAADGSVSSMAAGDAEPKAVAEEPTNPGAEAAQATKLPEEPTVAGASQKAE